MQNYLAHPDHQMILPNQDGQNGNGSSKFEGKALFIRYILKNMILTLFSNLLIDPDCSFQNRYLANLPYFTTIMKLKLPKLKRLGLQTKEDK